MIRRLAVAGGCLLAGLLACGAPAASAQEKVLWLKTDWSPVFMPDGDGFGDAVLAWLQARLPGYSHEARRQPLARLLKTMEDRQAIVCTTNLMRTPAREAQFLISRDIMRMPALGLVIRSADAELFRPLRDARGRVEFRRLLQQTKIDGAINENRSYGTELDALLREAPPSSAPVSRLPKTANMVAMLAVDRVDWILLYPFEATWLARQEAGVPPLTALPIAEIPAVNLGGVTCNRAGGAEKLVAAIDRLIEIHPDEPWLKPMYDWLDPETRARVSRKS